ncbi:hypothetical protein DPMN_054531 [Dreissena polymorpha]|uniref:Uncharacterized protein n=1 Tax=Dreissena polymorpha TaxID=45954 RepID=A0A9D4CQI6_DREPO|nr:hypothetical protein DPMN_054531 [Dreissena polymorpha]
MCALPVGLIVAPSYEGPFELSSAMMCVRLGMCRGLPMGWPRVTPVQWEPITILPLGDVTLVLLALPPWHLPV